MRNYTNKYFLLFVLCLLGSVTSYSQTTLLPEGTPVKVRIDTTISSKTSKVGDLLYFTLSEPILLGGKVLMDTKEKILGEVIESSRARSLGRPGKLDFVITVGKAVDEQTIYLRTTSKQQTGTNRTGGVVAAAVLLTPIALFIKGKEVEIEAGREFVVYVDKNYDIRTQ